MRTIVKENWPGLLFLVITWLIFFWRILFGGQVYFLDDLKILYYPIEYVYARAQSAWALPVWSNYFGFGHPLIAWGQQGFFTPLHLVLRFLQLPPVILLNVSTIAYSLAGLVGMHAFLRHSKLNQLSATLGAVTFGFSGFTIGHLNHVNFYTATMLLPWLMFTISHLIAKPTLAKTAGLALITAAIPLSGQPQISLYTFIIAFLFGIWDLMGHWGLGFGHFMKVIGLTLLAGMLAFCLASFAILPLREFLPITDRAGDLSPEELYEFSYPPSHLITLLTPYHFGDHTHYWGAKNFQELAAYVGWLPLLLAPVGLLWPTKRWGKLRLTSLLLIAIAFAFAPGKYSFIYRFLIDNHYLTTLAIPGRFVYFFDVGVAILAAIGLEIILLPRTIKAILVGLGAANLIWWGWDYNPLTPRGEALTASPFTEILREYEKTSGLPARLYAVETLPLTGSQVVTRQPTEAISPHFTVHQPLTLKTSSDCLSIPFLVDQNNAIPITVTARTSFSAPEFFSVTLRPSDLNLAQAYPVYKLCPRLSPDKPTQAILSFTSKAPSAFQLLERPLQGSEEPVLFVRVENPTPEQLERSRKNSHLDLTQDSDGQKQSSVDFERDLLLRHIHATANVSSARWIGALSIANYRAFIEQFFANDHDPFDGEGLHALTRFHNLVNLAGITHLTQALPDHLAQQDPVIQSGYELVKEDIRAGTHLRLYQNPQAFPKAFLVGTAVWESGADQTRYGLSQPNFDGSRLVYVSGPTPPKEGTINNSNSLNPAQFSRHVFEAGQVKITRYDPTEVDITVETAEPGWLVLSDAYTPQWQTLVDDQATSPTIANSIFRAAYIPAGSHSVSFQYTSPAIQQAKALTLFGLTATAACLLPWLLGRLRRQNVAE